MPPLQMLALTWMFKGLFHWHRFRLNLNALFLAEATILGFELCGCASAFGASWVFCKVCETKVKTWQTCSKKAGDVIELHLSRGWEEHDRKELHCSALVFFRLLPGNRLFSMQTQSLLRFNHILSCTFLKEARACAFVLRHAVLLISDSRHVSVEATNQKRNEVMVIFCLKSLVCNYWL